MTPKERDMLDAIKRLTVRGVPPTYDELARDLGMANKSQVHNVVHGLAAEGLIRLEKGYRGIRLLEPPAHIVAAIAEACSDAAAEIIGKGPLGRQLEPVVLKAWMDAQ